MFDKAGVSVQEIRTENLNLDDAENYELGQKSKLMSLKQETRLMLLQFQKVKDSRAQSRDMDSHRGPMAHGSKYHRHAGSNGSCI